MDNEEMDDRIICGKNDNTENEFDETLEECFEFTNELLRDILDFKKEGIEVDKCFIDSAFRIKLDLIKTYIDTKVFVKHRGCF